MYWADKIAKQIIASDRFQPYWVDDMKTPSGRVHVGALRGVIVHDLVHRALKDQGRPVTFTYVFEDHDPMDDVPVYLDRAVYAQHLGKPLFSIPSPDKKAKNYAEYFALDFQKAFRKIGSDPEIIWTGGLYKTGRMNADIKTCLDKAAVIKKIFETTYKKTIPHPWYPFQVCCPKCGKQSTTKVTNWNGHQVSFVCGINAVNWTNGCGYEGTVSPFSEKGHYAGKLPWKVEWPVKWKVIGVTIEGAGKDHMSAGGSHDVAEQICEQVLDYPTPYPVPYEFFLIGGKKMSSSKGRGSSAAEVSQSMPPYLLRFLMTRTRIEQAIDFDPEGDTIPDLFDEYDRCWYSYVSGNDQDLARVFELSQIDAVPEKEAVFLPRFRTVAQIVQFPNVDPLTYFAEEKGNALTALEKRVIEDRMQYAKIWLSEYAPEEDNFQPKQKVPDEAFKLSVNQQNFLRKLQELLDTVKSAEELQQKMYDLSKTLNISAKDAFAAIYLTLLGKTHGPKAAWYIWHLPRNFVKERFAAVQVKQPKKTNFTFSLLNKPELFSISQEAKARFPSITVGIAIIKNVTVTKENSGLQEEIDLFLDSIKGLTTETLGKFPEIQSYRKIYKETGIDWHSRRPSPEALLRRVVLNKGLYSINSCVDAYNLVVMRNRVSSGAFNLNAIKFPTELRFARAGESIHLLGDEEPTPYKTGEIAYFDAIGGFNIDFNYRDAKRTKVDEQTKNLWINIDGVYEITRAQVEKTLQETIDLITKYCGGTVETAGIVTAS
ncbi:lysine--tRNA ligase [Candidatus Microgenomates bacterium]|nr:MAG: lysine--tRNA ligase [Candidatus Microgenomates bacterium]